MATTANELLDVISTFLDQPLSLDELYATLGGNPIKDKCELDPP